MRGFFYARLFGEIQVAALLRVSRDLPTPRRRFAIGARRVYRVVYPARPRDDPRTAALRDWLANEVATMRA
ncbi:hypothetical protein [Burkholderia sp. BCC0405]|uniref:hypothetical protein n=1 Tax=Burkholderia sp. BCC0405 TaxID=2676298 RepID=UPI001FC85444|nr:hypothetical protein [Burkholderia sp. BCC0405]